MAAASNGHIEITLGVRGGRARIAGRRITVDDIVIMHLRLGQAVEEIADKYCLPLSAVYATLAYYFDHRSEIDQMIADDDAYFEAFKRDNPSKLQAKLKALRNA